MCLKFEKCWSKDKIVLQSYLLVHLHHIWFYRSGELTGLKDKSLHNLENLLLNVCYQKLTFNYLTTNY